MGTRVKSLLGLHALSGSDITGSIRNKGKMSFWKAFLASDIDILRALESLGSAEQLETKVEQQLERFICQVYTPGTDIIDIGNIIILKRTHFL